MTHVLKLTKMGSSIYGEKYSISKKSTKNNLPTGTYMSTKRVFDSVNVNERRLEIVTPTNVESSIIWDDLFTSREGAARRENICILLGVFTIWMFLGLFFFIPLCFIISASSANKSKKYLAIACEEKDATILFHVRRKKKKKKKRDGVNKHLLGME